MENIESGEYSAGLSAVSAADCVFEFMLNALRLTKGFDEDLFTARTGLSADRLRQRLEASIEKGLIAAEGAHSWCATPLGRRFLNDLQAEFLPD